MLLLLRIDFSTNLVTLSIAGDVQDSGQCSTIEGQFSVFIDHQIYFDGQQVF